MKVSHTSDETMIIELTRDELSSCFLTYEKINEEFSSVTRVLTRIISEAHRLSGEGMPVDDSSVFDVLPDGDGGCLIVVTSPREQSQIIRIYESRDTDLFMDMSRAIAGCEKTHSSLYRAKDAYRLIIGAPEATHRVCAEFLVHCDEGVTGEQRTKEHFSCLIKEGASEILGGLTAKQ